MRRLPAILVFTLMLVLSAPVALSEERHTPGFPLQTQPPQSLDEIARESLNVTDIKISSLNETVIRELLGNLTASGLLNESYSSMVNRTLESNTTTLLANINNTSLQAMLRSLLEKNEVSPENIASILEYIDTLKARGELSSSDELAVYRILADLASKKGDSLLASMLMSRMLTAIMEAAGHQSLYQESIPAGVSTPILGLKAPGAFTPQGFKIPMPVLPGLTGFLSLQLATPLLVFTAIFALVLLTTSQRARITGILGRVYSEIHLKLARSSAVKTTAPGDCISAYWASISFIKQRYGYSKMPSETHREYLRRVSGKLPSREAALLEEITMLYEECRFNPLLANRREVDEKTVRKYIELVSLVEEGKVRS
ncbi:MAG: DUF4129 domain-containing protein [Desulfurococcus sp.]|nr:DUF4129 domain-containing protein [Desulfurococcus sp.]